MDFAAYFAQVRRALANLTFSEEEITSIIGVIAAILHLGELEFQTSPSGVAELTDEAVRLHHPGMRRWHG